MGSRRPSDAFGCDRIFLGPPGGEATFANSVTVDAIIRAVNGRCLARLAATAAIDEKFL